jgi:undecaprenyl-diphosphatase
LTETLKIVLLAIVQGVTEFLPISSSGHLNLLQRGLGNEHDHLFISVVLHSGTLAAIVVCYRHEIGALMQPKNRRMIGLLLIGTLPLAFPGLLLRPLVKEIYHELWLTGAGLIITGIVLLFVHRPAVTAATPRPITWRTAIFIGLMQCLAIVPGISRSGTTIGIATRLGIDTATAAKFSFLLAIPAIASVELIETIARYSQADAAAMSVPPGVLTIGFVVAMVVGYLSLSFLLHILRRGKLSYFGYYCLAAGAATLVTQLTNN